MNSTLHPIVDYAAGMTPEQVSHMVSSMSPEQRRKLALEMIHGINRITESVVQDTKHLWLTGELPLEKL